MDGARDVKAGSVPGAAGFGGGRLVSARPLQTGPLAGELTSSLIGRVAGRYGMERGEVLAPWSLTGSPARHPEGGGVRADAEVVLNGAGRGGRCWPNCLGWNRGCWPGPCPPT